MLYWRYSATRVFFLNEYWIFLPAMLISNYFIMRTMKSRKKRIEELKELQKMVERYKKLQKFNRICHFACGLSVGSVGSLVLSGLLRGGYYIDDEGNLVDVVDVDYIKCGIEEGIRYLDNDRIRKIIIDLYFKKIKRKVIFITATAACHLAKKYGTTFLALPIAVGDFGLTNLYHTLRKLCVTILLGAIGPLYIAGNPLALGVAAILGTSGLYLAFIDLDKLPTTIGDETIPIDQIKPRIADLPDVLTVNYRNKVKAPSIIPPERECWLPEQSYFNPNCRIKTTIKTTEIPTAVNLATRGLEYDDVVNMRDVTNLERVDFSDIFDLGKPQTSISKVSTSISKVSTSISKASKGKEVNFLDLFGDPAEIPESETWDVADAVDTIAERTNLRTKE